jgi:hypothetical protein
MSEGRYYDFKIGDSEWGDEYRLRHCLSHKGFQWCLRILKFKIKKNKKKIVKTLETELPFYCHSNLDEIERYLTESLRSIKTPIEVSKAFNDAKKYFGDTYEI